MKNILSKYYLYLRIFKTNWDFALPLKSLSLYLPRGNIFVAGIFFGVTICLW